MIDNEAIFCLIVVFAFHVFFFLKSLHMIEHRAVSIEL